MTTSKHTPISIGNERGQAMTEFALVLPLLALILFAVIQFGITFNNYITVTDAVRAGARKAAVSRGTANPAGTVEAAVRASAAGLDPNRLDVEVESHFERGTDVTVSASYPYSISLLGLVVRSGWLKSTTTERVE